MLNHSDNLEIYQRHLPHWRLEYAIYFVTWRLHPTNALLEPDERALVANAIEHFHTQRYHLIAYVVMDDHVHVLLRLTPGTELEATVHTWKSYTANKLQRTRIRESRVWQGEYFDRIMRDSDELINTLQYIDTNPQKRWPDLDHYPWRRLYNA